MISTMISDTDRRSLISSATVIECCELKEVSHRFVPTVHRENELRTELGTNGIGQYYMLYYCLQKRPLFNNNT